jgi:RND superfamily putative drug exporter
MFDRLGALVFRLRYFLVVGWLVAAALFGAFAPSLSQAGSADETSFLPHDAESLTARQVIADGFPNDTAPAVALIVFSRQGGLTDADRAAIEGLRGYLEGANHPAEIVRYVTAESTPSLASMFRSSDNVVELAQLDMAHPSFLPVTNDAIDAVRAHIADSGTLPSGLTAQITGQAGIGRDYLMAIKEGTDRTTYVTIILVVLVLLLIYRAPLAALAPLLTIGSAFLVARGILGLMAQAGVPLSSVLDSFIVVLVFGVGTDYTIFFISRFREELAKGDRDEALRVTVGRISAVIAASGATVFVGLGSMIVARFGMIQTTGPALAVAVLVTLLAGLTLTPSLLAIFGRRLFWPLHESTHTAADEDRGFWAGLSRRITGSPALVTVVVLAALLVPSLALPQVKENFDVLNELPAGAESRLGFETLSQHLAEGQLMPLTVLVKVPAANATALSSQQGLSGIGAFEKDLLAIPNVQTVRSEVDPTGEGNVSDLVRPSVQLAKMATAFGQPASTDLNAELGDASVAGVDTAAAYIGGLGTAFPKLSATNLAAADQDLATLSSGLKSARAEALVPNQLDGIATKLVAATATATAPGSGTASGPSADTAAQLTALKSYLAELGAALPDAAAQQSYRGAVSAVDSLLSGTDQAAGAQLIGSIRDLSAWFKARPTPFYFAPTAISPSDGLQATQVAMTAARARLPAEIATLASAFSATDLYATSDLRSSFVSADGTIARLYVTTSTNPYDQKSFDTVKDIRALVATDPGHLGAAQFYVGGASAEFADVQDTISSDFLRVALITILGILVVLILLLRALVAPIYLVLTVLLSYVTSLSLSTLILRYVFGQAGINYFIPLMVFVLLVALGSDYNIFLMSRVREESSTRDLRSGIRVASARTGTVITSAGLILAGTFGAMVSSPLQLLFQVGLMVGLGVLIDTFVVRSLLVPAITATIGERAWWPFHRRTS